MIAQHSSQSVEHPTPAEVVERARALLGGFDLDPASTATFNRSVRADRIYTRRDDGLTKPWNGRVFLNPPGGVLIMRRGRWVARKGRGPGQSSMRIWWEKLVDEYKTGAVAEALFVGFTLEILRTSQACPYPVQRFARCYPRNRLAFKGNDPTHANVLVFLSDAPNAVKRLRGAFGDLGLCESGYTAERVR